FNGFLFIGYYSRARAGLQGQRRMAEGRTHGGRATRLAPTDERLALHRHFEASERRPEAASTNDVLMGPGIPEDSPLPFFNEAASRPCSERESASVAVVLD